jgi:hypothetical protein
LNPETLEPQVSHLRPQAYKNSAPSFHPPQKFFPRFQLHSPLFKGSRHSCLLNIKTYNSLHQIYKGREKGSKVQRVKGFRERIMIVLRAIEILVRIILMNSVYSDIFNIKCAREFRRECNQDQGSLYFNKLESCRPAILNIIQIRPTSGRPTLPHRQVVSFAQWHGSISETHLQFLRHFCLNF